MKLGPSSRLHLACFFVIGCFALLGDARFVEVNVTVPADFPRSGDTSIMCITTDLGIKPLKLIGVVPFASASVLDIMLFGEEPRGCCQIYCALMTGTADTANGPDWAWADWACPPRMRCMFPYIPHPAHLHAHPAAATLARILQPAMIPMLSPRRMGSLSHGTAQQSRHARTAAQRSCMHGTGSAPLLLSYRLGWGSPCQEIQPSRTLWPRCVCVCMCVCAKPVLML